MSPEKTDTARLIFTEEFTEELADIVEMKGWCGLGMVELPNGTRFDVLFIEPTRLQSDLESHLRSGRVCVAEPGMIVIPKVTRDYMDAAVQELYKSGYFNSLKSI
ncbi:MAG TPA: hypothetical protein VIB39_19305 [Candidatus Angelobacter sp.]|jgi:hypothetical protein